MEEIITVEMITEGMTTEGIVLAGKEHYGEIKTY